MTNITDAQRLLVADRAKTIGFQNKYYQYGGIGPDGYDCSGLALKAWAGIFVLPHNTTEQAKLLKAVAPNSTNRAKLQPGDLVFYYGSYLQPELISHVAVFLEEYNGMWLVAQATDTEHGSEVIRMQKYAVPSAFGFVGHS